MQAFQNYSAVIQLSRTLWEFNLRNTTSKVCSIPSNELMYCLNSLATTRKYIQWFCINLGYLALFRMNFKNDSVSNNSQPLRIVCRCH